MIKLVAIAAFGLSLPAFAEEADENPFYPLVKGPGQEETYYACGVCHSLRIVAMQGLTKVGWEETIDWMIDEQEMEPLEAEERALIVSYLATHYGTDRPNYPAQ